MGDTRLILASASPRRRDLLTALGASFEVRPTHADETLPPDLSIPEALQIVALRKARDAFDPSAPSPWILAADTAVVVDDCVLGKPVDREQACTMLRLLSGRSHRVITAVAFLGKDRETTRCSTTEVVFRPLRSEQIQWYAGLDEPYDKAGGYAIQGRGAFLVESISGSYTNVVGLPMAEVTTLLDEVGLTPWTPAAAQGPRLD